MSLELTDEQVALAESVRAFAHDRLGVSALRRAHEPVIRALTLTGSTAAGRSLAAKAGNMIRAVMELGGHAPVVARADAEPEAVAAGTARAAYRNAAAFQQLKFVSEQ